jgi:hypothetical protein
LILEIDKRKEWIIGSIFLLLYQNILKKKKLAEAWINIKDGMETFIFDVDNFKP